MSKNQSRKTPTNSVQAKISRAWMEPLENRRLLHGFGFGFGFGGHGHDGGGFGGGGFGGNVSSIEFSQAPTAVQTGLDNLATADNLTAPTATQTVQLGNRNGEETYTIDLIGTGTFSALTVDATGSPVTAPTHTAPTFGDITDTAVTNEFTAIATALSLTAPTSTTAVQVSAPAGSTVSTYTVRLTNSSGNGHGGRSITIDSNGNPVGTQSLPFSVFSTTIQDGLNTNMPTGATALAATSTQTVHVRTLNGVTTYSTTYTTSGTTTTVTVNASGQLTKLPSHTTAQFSTIPAPTQTEIQTLATADGVAGTIATTQNVQVYDEANGTTIYSVTLQASKTGSTSGKTYTVNLTFAADQNGNPTTVPQNGGGDFGSSFGNFSGESDGGFGFFGIVRGRHGWF
ncbi:MAG TPA: hypothetical protein VFE47_13510 [Tepidisphaeraceae bacterium]|jgi:hypothetical protein|nr:hypothetical protein [Tepidisphaeraceae bacterium]